MNEWNRKILSKVEPGKRHVADSAIFQIDVTEHYEDERYMTVVAERIEQRKAKRKAEAAA